MQRILCKAFTSQPGDDHHWHRVPVQLRDELFMAAQLDHGLDGGGGDSGGPHQPVAACGFVFVRPAAPEFRLAAETLALSYSECCLRIICTLSFVEVQNGRRN